MTESEKSSLGAVTCHHCSRSFKPKFSFQTAAVDGATVFYCSKTCRNPGLRGDIVACSVCDKSFTPTLAAHISESAEGQIFFCSMDCRETAAGPRVAEKSTPPRVIAILNQKGGTAKTTTAVSIASGLARQGMQTMLIDLDPQGNVGVSLGVQSPRTSYHLLVKGIPPETCAIRARENLSVITCDEGLAAAEIDLARSDGLARTDRLANAMSSLRGFDYVIIDCAPSLSVLNHNVLAYAGEVLIPVSCDYLALVGVKQVLRTVRRVGEQTGRQVRVAGVLPTFYDVRNKVCGEVLGYLRKSFGARTLPPVRVNTKLAEAPSFKRTIFEHAVESNGARDYVRVVEWLRTSTNIESATRAA